MKVCVVESHLLVLRVTDMEYSKERGRSPNLTNASCENLESTVVSFEHGYKGTECLQEWVYVSNSPAINRMAEDSDQVQVGQLISVALISHC